MKSQIIYNRLSKVVSCEKKLQYEFDIRYLSKWIINFPKCFPKFVRDNKFKIVYNENILDYELIRIS